MKKIIICIILILSLTGCTGNNYQATPHHPNHPDPNSVEIEQSDKAKEIGEFGALLLLDIIWWSWRL